MASLVPARLLGLGDRGRLAPGYRADLAVLSREFEPLERWPQEKTSGRFAILRPQTWTTRSHLVPTPRRAGRERLLRDRRSFSCSCWGMRCSSRPSTRSSRPGARGSRSWPSAATGGRRRRCGSWTSRSASSRRSSSGSRSSRSFSVLSASRSSRAASMTGSRDGVAFVLSFLIVTYLTSSWASSCRRRSRSSGPKRSALWLAVPLDWLGRIDLPGRLGAADVRERHRPALRRPAGARRDDHAHGGGHPPHRRGRDRGDRAGRGGDALQGLRLRRQGGPRGDGPAARGCRALGRAARLRRRSRPSSTLRTRATRCTAARSTT